MTMAVRGCDMAEVRKASSGTLQLLTPQDAAWGRYLRTLPEAQQDVFYSPEYAAVCGRYLYPGAQVFCAVLETETSTMLYPFVRRRISSLLPGMGLDPAAQDITSLYGRGGLIASRIVPDDLARFHDAFGAYCETQRIVCGFDRYHPVLKNHRLASVQTTVWDVGGFIVADLADPLDVLEQRFKHAVRKNLKKAERAGVRVFSEATTGHVGQFMAIYASTLERNQARDFYYLDRAFYETLAEGLKGRYRFFYAALGDTLISCELVLLQGRYCHSFLGGTLAAYLDTCPNHLLKQHIIREAKEMGCQHYLLGGGQRPGDGIWRYKQGFAVRGNRPSLVGGTVFDQGAYEALRARLSESGMAVGAERFQFYDPC